MGTLNAIYIGAANATSIKAIKNAYPEAVSEHWSQFFWVQLADNAFDCPESSLLSVSKNLGTDVLWLSFQSTVNAFRFFHWCDGQPLRALVYGCIEERTWDRAEGVPELWEQEAIFERTDLGDTLTCYEDPSERREIELIYRDHVLSPGNFHPMLDSRETARAVATFYRLPGWDLKDAETLIFRSAEPLE